MLVHLDADTWGTPGSREALCGDIALAMVERVPLLLVHEAPGIDQEVRSSWVFTRASCEFDAFFRPDATPAPLLAAGCVQ